MPTQLHLQNPIPKAQEPFLLLEGFHSAALQSVTVINQFSIRKEPL